MGFDEDAFGCSHVLRTRRPNGLRIVVELEQLDGRSTGFNHERNRSNDIALDDVVDDDISHVREPEGQPRRRQERPWLQGGRGRCGRLRHDGQLRRQQRFGRERRCGRERLDLD